jgi:hypothetical protein
VTNKVAKQKTRCAAQSAALLSPPHTIKLYIFYTFHANKTASVHWVNVSCTALCYSMAWKTATQYASTARAVTVGIESCKGLQAVCSQQSLMLRVDWLKRFSSTSLNFYQCKKCMMSITVLRKMWLILVLKLFLGWRATLKNSWVIYKVIYVWCTENIVVIAKKCLSTHGLFSHAIIASYVLKFLFAIFTSYYGHTSQN